MNKILWFKLKFYNIIFEICKWLDGRAHGWMWRFNKFYVECKKEMEINAKISKRTKSSGCSIFTKIWRRLV